MLSPSSSPVPNGIVINDTERIFYSPGAVSSVSPQVRGAAANREHVDGRCQDRSGAHSGPSFRRGVDFAKWLTAVSPRSPF